MFIFEEPIHKCKIISITQRKFDLHDIHIIFLTQIIRIIYITFTGVRSDII